MSEALLHYNSAVVGNMSCDEYKKNPIECLGCRLVDQCEAGQKTVERLEMETKPSAEKSDRERKADEARERFEKALASGDPVQWFFDNTAVSSQKAAKNTFARYMKKYPDIWEAHKAGQVESVRKYGSITPMVKPVKNPVQLRIVAEKPKRRPNEYDKERTRKGRENLLQALLSDNPVDWYVKNGSVASIENIRTAFNHSKKKWPDIVQEAERIKATRRQSVAHVPDAPKTERLATKPSVQSQPGGTTVITYQMVIDMLSGLKEEKRSILSQIESLKNRLQEIEESKKKLQSAIDDWDNI